MPELVTDTPVHDAPSPGEGPSLEPAVQATLAETRGDWDRAAALWQAADRPRRAAVALEHAGCPEAAAQLLIDAGLHRAAARQLMRIELPLLAAEQYERAKDPLSAAQVRVRAIEQADRYHIPIDQLPKIAQRAAALFTRLGRPEAAEQVLALAAGAPAQSDEAAEPTAEGDDAGQLRAQLIARFDAQGQRSTATQLLYRSLEAAPLGGLQVEPLVRYAQLLEEQGQAAAARSAYRRVLRLEPDHAESVARLRALGATIDLDPAAPSASLSLGQRLRDRFRIDGPARPGPRVFNYWATDAHLGQPARISVLRPTAQLDPRIAERFMTEARLAARVQHLGVPAVLDFGQHQGLCFIATAAVAGTPLCVGEALPPARAIRLAVQAASALAALHRAGLVHGALTPACFEHAPDGRLRLCQLGPATAIGDDDTLGAAYAAPEPRDHCCPDPRLDVYSLGAILLSLLTGQPPQAVPALPPALKTQTREVLRLALSPDPRRRFCSMTAFSQLLQTL